MNLRMTLQNIFIHLNVSCSLVALFPGRSSSGNSKCIAIICRLFVLGWGGEYFSVPVVHRFPLRNHSRDTLKDFKREILPQIVNNLD